MTSIAQALGEAKEGQHIAYATAGMENDLNRLVLVDRGLPLSKASREWSRTLRDVVLLVIGTLRRSPNKIVERHREPIAPVMVIFFGLNL